MCALALGTSAAAPALVECTARLLRRHELCDFSEVLGSSPLRAALYAGNTTVARMLLHAGAQVGQINFSTLMPSADGLALLLNESSGGLLPSSVVDLHAVFRAGRRDLLTQLIPWLNGLPPSQVKQVLAASSSSYDESDSVAVAASSSSSSDDEGSSSPSSLSSAANPPAGAPATTTSSSSSLPDVTASSSTSSGSVATGGGVSRCRRKMAATRAPMRTRQGSDQAPIRKFASC